MEIKTIKLNSRATGKTKAKKSNKVTKTPVKKGSAKKASSKKTSVKAVVAAPAPVVVPVVAPPVPVVVAAPPVKTEAQEIWDEIRFLKIDMFGLPSQLVEQHCTPVPIEPTHLYLTIRSSATLPALETSLTEYTEKMNLVAQKTNTVNKSKFTVELADKFVIVTRVKPSIFTNFK